MARIRRVVQDGIAERLHENQIVDEHGLRSCGGYAAHVRQALRGSTIRRHVRPRAREPIRERRFVGVRELAVWLAGHVIPAHLLLTDVPQGALGNTLPRHESAEIVAQQIPYEPTGAKEIGFPGVWIGRVVNGCGGGVCVALQDFLVFMRELLKAVADALHNSLGFHALR